MLSKFNVVKKIAWRTLTSPSLAVTIGAIGAVLQLIQQIDAYKKGNRKIGFKMDD